MMVILKKIGILLATVVIMFMAGSLIIVVHIAKLFRRFSFRDPFRNSREHPLNSPEASRG